MKDNDLMCSPQKTQEGKTSPSPEKNFQSSFEEEWGHFVDLDL